MFKTSSLYEKFIEKIGFLGFLSFAMTFISIFVEMGFQFLGLPMERLLPSLFFGSTFFCFGLLALLQNKENKLSYKNVNLVGGFTMFFVGFIVLIVFGWIAINKQPFYLFFFLATLIFAIIIPKGIFKEEKAEYVSFTSDSVVIKKNNLTNKIIPYSSIKKISILEGSNTLEIVLEIVSTLDTTSYALENSFLILKDSLDKLQGFSKVEQFIQSSNGKPLKNIMIIDSKTPTRTIVNNGNIITEYYNQTSGQWLREGRYRHFIQYINKNFSGKSDENAWIRRVIVSLFIFMLIVSIGFVFIPKKNYLANGPITNSNQKLIEEKMIEEKTIVAGEKATLRKSGLDRWYYVRGNGNYANKTMSILLFSTKEIGHEYTMYTGENIIEKKKCADIGIAENGNIILIAAGCEGETLNTFFGEYLADNLLIKEVRIDDLNELNSYAVIEASPPK
jgi:hypothetical protein